MGHHVEYGLRLFYPSTGGGAIIAAYTGAAPVRLTRSPVQSGSRSAGGLALMRIEPAGRRGPAFTPPRIPTRRYHRPSAPASAGGYPPAPAHNRKYAHPACATPTCSNNQQIQSGSRKPVRLQTKVLQRGKAVGERCPFLTLPCSALRSSETARARQRGTDFRHRIRKRVR